MQFRVLNREIEDDGSLNINVEVKFQAPLAEARQQALAFTNILGKLAPVEGAAKASGQPGLLPDNVTPLQKLMGKIQA
ncbi:hypothetical protein G9E11_01925 [Arthrobacter sp. IA7]|uniref:hypothetical protein n=1 Tax=Arthrobacter ipis TaxID=2716202 RepID=UPI001683E666|nr:hypothetical protein [Arthrobacter ipis]MBD1541032.1 hypothetical protein [Arthrobacter ipis]